MLAGWKLSCALLAILVALVAAAAVRADGSCGAMPCRSSGIPYVTYDGAIVIFPGERFVIAFQIEDGKIVSAQPRPAGGSLSDAVEVSFKQIGTGMMLAVASHLPDTIRYDATMKAPDDRMHLTSSCPVRAGQSSFESWPHPIKFLELSNFRLQASGPCA